MKNTFSIVTMIALFFTLVWPPLFNAPWSYMTSSILSPVHLNARIPNDDFWGDSQEEVSPTTQALAKVLQDGEGVIYGLIGIGVLSSTAAFAFQAFKLGKSHDPKSRSEAIGNLITIAITTSALGGFAIFYNFLIAIMTHA